jgi:glycosyltransferase involved in cell wall biosynthesis
MLVSLLTRGTPDQLTGGYLYHRRIAELADASDATVEFVPVHVTANPYAASSGDVVLVDSIAAAAVAPWGRPTKPLAAIIHQPPGGIDGPRSMRTLRAALDRVLYRRCQVLLAASDALGRELAVPRHRLPRTRIRVVPPGRDVAAAAHAPVDLRCGRQAAFVTVGNWMARKGIIELLAAFSLLDDDRATLHLAGRDDLEPRYATQVRARIAAPDLVARVVYHGTISREQVAGLYAAADAFVLPSFREPYGTVYGEALAAGLPVVGWRAGNLPELVTDGVEGVVVAPGDVRGLAAALDRLATDVAWRKQLAVGAARRGERLPTWAETAANVFTALRELV